MKAIAATENGGVDRLQLMDLPIPIPIPEPPAGEVLVRVLAAGVNLVDTLFREGYVDSDRRPLVMGSDLSGVVERPRSWVEAASRCSSPPAAARGWSARRAPATASTVRELGASEVVDYTAGDWVAAVRERVGVGAAALLEAVGGETKRLAPEALRHGGRLAWITGDPRCVWSGGSAGPTCTACPPRHARRPDRADRCRPIASADRTRVYPLAEAAAAQERVAGGHLRGKLVVDLAATGWGERDGSRRR